MLVFDKFASLALAMMLDATASRKHDNINRRTAVAPAAAIAAAFDVGRPDAVDGEGYIPSSALELPPSAAATVANTAAALATAPARLTRASRKHDNISRRTAVAPAAAIAAASGVGRPGAVDGEGYIPSSALELPPSAAATVANTAAVLATAPAHLARATSSRKHGKISRHTAVAPAAAIAAASGVGRPGAVDGEGYTSAGPRPGAGVGRRAKDGQLNDGPGERARARRAVGGQWKGDSGGGDGGDGGDADIDVGAGASGQARVEASRRAKGGQPRGGVGEIGNDEEHARLDGESGGGSEEEKDSTDGGEKGVRTKQGLKNGMSGRDTTNSDTANPAVESV